MILILNNLGLKIVKIKNQNKQIKVYVILFKKIIVCIAKLSKIQFAVFKSHDKNRVVLPCDFYLVISKLNKANKIFNFQNSNRTQIKKYTDRR